MSAFFKTPDGQFVAVVALYLIAVTMRAFGFAWAEQDHAMFAGALLTLLKYHGDRQQ